jgi:hypothetical protein
MKIMTLWGEEEVEETFKCIHCQETLPIHIMSTDSHHTRRSECIPCRRDKAKSVTRLKKQYSMYKPSIDDECIICQRTGQEIIDRGSFTGRRTVWSLDHNHDTDEFRGWICQHCNNGLGGFRDNIESMERAVLYLKGELRKEIPSLPMISHDSPNY